MHSRFDQFRATPLGQQLEILIMDDRRYNEYAALSRAGVPAVAAIVHDLQTHFPEAVNDQVARQFCGAAVAEVMRQHYHEVLRPRGRVPGGVLTYGVIWMPLPKRLSFSSLLDVLRALPKTIETLYRQIPLTKGGKRPVGSRFSAVEHLCHLRDIDAVNEERVRLILTTSFPNLSSVDGLSMAEKYAYRDQQPEDALAEFHYQRASLLPVLAETSEDQWSRMGLRDGSRRISLLELIEETHQHYQRYVQEFQELIASLGRFIREND
ncbi:hypothetical protein ACH19I_10780 [Yersinia kristensenii]|uniref:hypothetical protein n=1 Tax=Yersinia kristensenii TaxID=28152 RepID=UPI003896D45C